MDILQKLKDRLAHDRAFVMVTVELLRDSIKEIETLREAAATTGAEAEHFTDEIVSLRGKYDPKT